MAERRRGRRRHATRSVALDSSDSRNETRVARPANSKSSAATRRITADARVGAEEAPWRTWSKPRS